ncbi:hypothetical protein HPB47_013598 [Ixodes persulcatus]|uniref:Uncharacterized protein n=1 Tax=Ixodes persulcatus TaxID=34615 RepID=A0AC60QZH3_IXOPE|nr:hypothetical protein HPB47_013598 [Ixodes persulcatus]
MRKFPADEKLRAVWTRLARPSFPTWVPTPDDRLCSDHFRDDDYERSPRALKSFGLPTKSIRLKAGVVPSIFSKKRKANPLSEPLEKRRRVAPLLDVTNLEEAEPSVCSATQGASTSWLFTVAASPTTLGQTGSPSTPTEYVGELMAAVLDLCKTMPSYAAAIELHSQDAPPFLSSAYECADKQALVQQYQSRFNEVARWKGPSISLSCCSSTRASQFSKSKEADIRLTFKDGTPMPVVKRVRILDLHLQRDGGAKYTVDRLVETTTQVMRMMSRITSHRLGLKESDLIQLTQALVLSLITYATLFLSLLSRAKGKMDVIIRKAY